jgi:hypothetical protein
MSSVENNHFKEKHFVEMAEIHVSDLFGDLIER